MNLEGNELQGPSITSGALSITPVKYIKLKDMKGDDAEKWNDIFCPLADWFIKR